MGVGLEQRPGVAAAADGGVESPPGRCRPEQFDNLVHHDGPVPELLFGLDWARAGGPGWAGWREGAVSGS